MYRIVHKFSLHNNILQFSVVHRNNGELQSITTINKCSDVIINYNRVVFCFPLETHEA